MWRAPGCLGTIYRAQPHDALYCISPLGKQKERGRVGITDTTASPGVAKPRRPVPGTSGDLKQSSMCRCV